MCKCVCECMYVICVSSYMFLKEFRVSFSLKGPVFLMIEITPVRIFETRNLFPLRIECVKLEFSIIRFHVNNLLL